MFSESAGRSERTKPTGVLPNPVLSSTKLPCIQASDRGPLPRVGQWRVSGFECCTGLGSNARAQEHNFRDDPWADLHSSRKPSSSLTRLLRNVLRIRRVSSGRQTRASPSYSLSVLRIKRAMVTDQVGSARMPLRQATRGHTGRIGFTSD